MTDAGTVVGAVIVDDGRVLAARRTRPVELAGRWEFPGGKVEAGEDVGAALAREVREELGASIEIVCEVVGQAGPWPISPTYALRLFRAQVVRGDLRPGTDHDELRWLGPSALESVDWLPSDRAALAAVRRAVWGG